MGVKNFVFPNLSIVYDVCTNNQGDKQDFVIEDGVFHDNLSKNSMAFIDHIPGDLNSVNKTIKIPTIPSGSFGY
jgi:hypothetical protein